jgi:hypothetical protein
LISQETLHIHRCSVGVMRIRPVGKAHFQLKFSKLQAIFYHLDSPDFVETHSGQ